MDYRLTSEQEAFRRKFASWLKKNLPDGFDPSRIRNFQTDEAWGDAYRGFQRKLFDAGYAGMHYPKAYGGQGKGLMEEVIVLQGIASTCMELRTPGQITLGMPAPTIYMCGTEEQKQEFLPKILNGTHIWCQAFSEPDAGSDVANVSTTAVRENDHYIVNGQKVWTSFAHLADWCILLVRTNPGGKKHQGLSYLLLDMNSPGVEVNPIRQITGEYDFNEVFLDDVKVPVEMLVGKEGDGWKIAITTLMFERASGDAVMGTLYETNIARILEMARLIKNRGSRVIDSPVFRQQLGQAYVDIMAQKYHGLRNLSLQIQGGAPGPEGSIGKLLRSEADQQVAEAAMDMLGPSSQIMQGSPWSVQQGYWQWHYMQSRANTIWAGTSEIQRNIIGERVLGLPKDASRTTRQ